MATQNSQMVEGRRPGSCRAEVDTSAPFESVKEAANLFGGMGFWKPASQQEREEVVDVMELEEQTAQLERDLIVKERETLDVLKELESTKNIVEELKAKLQKEASEINAALKAEATMNCIAEEGKHEKGPSFGRVGLYPSEAPGFILLELKQAKLNLTKTSTDLAAIRAAVHAYNEEIAKERASLEKTRQRLSSNASKILRLEEEKVKDNGVSGSSHDPINVARELQKLSSETELLRMVGEDAKSEVQRALSEIKQNKARIRTAEIRLIAAKKMKEAARASEAIAFAEMKALSSSVNKSKDVTLTFKEYSSLVSTARGADQSCKGKVADAMLMVDQAKASKMGIMKKVEEATQEVKTTKKALEEALSRVERAKQGKLAVEEALRVWRSEHGHRRRSVHNCSKFKNPSLLQRKDSLLVGHVLKPVIKPTLSIGEILSRKLLLTKEYENGMLQRDNTTGKHKVSLRQMLSRHGSDQHYARKSGKEDRELPTKKKKFGFARISLLVAKQSKKMKKSNVGAASPLCHRI